MREIGYYLAKIKYKLKGNDKETVSDYFRKAGMSIGKKCNICCNIMTSEPYLVEIGDNVTIAGNVSLLTHDNSIAKVLPDKTDIFGSIKIGNNCFIGANATIMYGVEICENVIVAAGSVVANSVYEPFTIIGGNPAKKISDWESFSQKGNVQAISVRNLSEAEKRQIVLENAIRK